MPNKKAKTKKVTVQESAKKPSWKDAGILMKKGATPKEQQEQQMIIALSIAFDIPPQGITILADNPYINKQGLEFVFHRHKEDRGWSHFLAKPVELAKQAGDTAIFETRLFNKEGQKIANGFGTANAGNIKMGTIKVFLNEMAETRSQNRCLRKVLSPILYQTFIDKVSVLKKEQRSLIAEASAKFGSVSVEEVGATSDSEVKAEKLLTEAEMKDIAKFLQEMNKAKDKKALESVGERIKTGIKVKRFSENQVAVLKEVWTSVAQKLAFKK